MSFFILLFWNPGLIPRTQTSLLFEFNNECYDLDKDGLYSATKHADFNHEVKIAVLNPWELSFNSLFHEVYNNYMREIQVVDTQSGEILLSIDTTGNAMSDKFKYHFTEHTFNCPSDMKKTECLDEFQLWEFDAQNFRFVVTNLSFLRCKKTRFKVDIEPVI